MEEHIKRELRNIGYTEPSTNVDEGIDEIDATANEKFDQPEGGDNDNGNDNDDDGNDNDET